MASLKDGKVVLMFQFAITLRGDIMRKYIDRCVSADLELPSTPVRQGKGYTRTQRIHPGKLSMDNAREATKHGRLSVYIPVLIVIWVLDSSISVTYYVS